MCAAKLKRGRRGVLYYLIIFYSGKNPRLNYSTKTLVSGLLFRRNAIHPLKNEEVTRDCQLIGGDFWTPNEHEHESVQFKHPNDIFHRAGFHSIG